MSHDEIQLFYSFLLSHSVQVILLVSTNVLPVPIKFQHFIKSSCDLQVTESHGAFNEVFNWKEKLLPFQSQLPPFFAKSMSSLSCV